jgi:hypothetical protein
MPSFGEESLALRAAVDDPAAALEAWSSVMASMDFADISRGTQRLAPLIYLNLKDLADVPERARLRGAYKHAWSSTHRLLTALQPVVRSLNAKGVNFRIVKGIAIQLALGIVGARVVGDVDLVVGKDDVAIVRDTLEELGFRCNSLSRCGLHPAGSVREALDFNRGDSHIDVHVAERKEPSALLKAMLATPPHFVECAGTPYPLPPAELLAVHSAAHGVASASETDLIQSLADMALIAPRCHHARTAAWARSVGLGKPVVSIGKTLTSYGLPLWSLPARGFSWSLARSSHPLVVGSPVRSARRALSLWRERFHRGKPLLSALRLFSGRKMAYFSWVLAGQFSSLEKALFAGKRGFLLLPGEMLPGGEIVFPFAGASGNSVSVSRVARECFDYRFAFRCSPLTKELVITFHGECVDDADVAVHYNGDRKLRMVSGSSARSVAILDPLEHSEVSLRPISGSCEACFSQLDSIGVSVEYRFPDRGRDAKNG